MPAHFVKCGICSQSEGGLNQGQPKFTLVQAVYTEPQEMGKAGPGRVVGTDHTQQALSLTLLTCKWLPNPM